MFKDSEIRIGINVGKAEREDRGITVYTRNILHEFGQVEGDYRFVLLHYPESVPTDKFGIENATLEALPFSSRHEPLATMIGEQVLNPILQKKLGLDVIWHPHNRGQFIAPVGYVCTMHDILPITNPELASKYLNSWQKSALYASRTYSANNADLIITGSDFSKSEIVEHLGSDPNKVVPIYYGIDRQVFSPNKKESDLARIREKYSLPERYLLTTGSYAPHKNHRVLVDAYNQSNLPQEGVGLVMVGPNDATGYRIGYELVKEHVQQLRLENNVRMLPSVPVEDLVSIYNGATIFSTASLHEGFGFTPLEAMACDVPVVVSNASAIPEVCADAALYANPNSPSDFATQFNVLLGDTDLQARLINKGRAQISKFDWQTTAKKTLEVLQSVAISRK